jgi:hypothetical protein
MTQSDQESGYSEAERRAIAEMQHAGLTPTDVLEKINAERGGGEPGARPATIDDIQRMFSDRDRKEAERAKQQEVARATDQKAQQISQAIGEQLAKQERFSERKRELLQQEVIKQLGSAPEILQARTEAEFMASLGTLTSKVIDAELAELGPASDQPASASDDTTEQNTVGPSKAVAPSFGRTAGMAPGPGSSTPPSGPDALDQPLYGPGVVPPKRHEIDAAWQQRMRDLERKHGMRIRT